MRAFALPDVGEGLTEAEILRWHVRPGDVVQVNQVIVEIETAKASVELPCPFAGTVEELHVAEGSIVPVGSPIISIATAMARPRRRERQAVLVGYGVREGGRRRRAGARRSTAQPMPQVAQEPAVVAAATSRARPAGEAAGAQARARPRASTSRRWPRRERTAR